MGVLYSGGNSELTVQLVGGLVQGRLDI
jgi:hypothetical protein